MKRLMKILGLITIVIVIATVISACAAQAPHYPPDAPPSNNDEFEDITETEYYPAIIKPESTFSMNINTAAYANIRSYIMSGHEIDPNQVKIEEMVNYFNYDYPEPEDGEPMSLSAEISDCPWNSEAELLRVGVKAKDIEMSEISNNIVFLLDVSGSMNADNKLGLVKNAFVLLANNLNDNDRVSIVTYAGNNRVVLEGTSGENKNEIINALNALTASGSTAGANGIQTAYQIAEEYFITDGNNRVILATDGDFNVGISSESGLESFISGKRDTGIYLSVLGFGYGNLKDNKLETLANNGNGNYAYIDTIDEARKVLIDEAGGTFVTVARDVKAQVIFNPAKVESYRLIGYENSLLSDEEWENNGADAGEIGAGRTVTAVYEIILNNTEEESTMGENLMKFTVKYKNPDINDYNEEEIFIYVDYTSIYEMPSEDQIFISAVIETALILRNSEYKGTSNYYDVIDRLQELDSIYSDELRHEFLQLVHYLN